MLGISHLGAAPGCEALHTAREQGGDEDAWAGLVSRRLLGHMVQERLPLFAGKKFEKTLGPTGSMAPVAFDLGPARSRGAAYHFHPHRWWQRPHDHFVRDPLAKHPGRQPVHKGRALTRRLK